MPCGNLGLLLGLSYAFHVSLLDMCNKLSLPCMELVLHLWTPAETCINDAYLFSLLLTIMCLDNDKCIVSWVLGG